MCLYVHVYCLTWSCDLSLLSRSPSACLSQKDEVYLNLVLDFVPETVYRVARHFNKAKTTIPIIYVKVSAPPAPSPLTRPPVGQG